MRLTLDEMNERLENQKSGGNFVNQFVLKDDKDSSIVRVLLNDITEVEAYAVHVVRMDSKAGKAYPLHVGCLGDNCPFCKIANNYKDDKFPLVSRVRDNIYIPLIEMYFSPKGRYDESEFVDEYKVWLRSTKFYRDTLVGYTKRNPIDKPIEIERNGKAGDNRTSFALYPANKDPNNKDIFSEQCKGSGIANASLESLKEKYGVKEDDIFGRSTSLIRNWTPEQMEMFLENPGVYPSLKEDEEDEEPAPKRRGHRGF